MTGVIRGERDFLAQVISSALGQPAIKAPPDSAGRLLYESPAGRFKVVVGPCASPEWDAAEHLAVTVPEESPDQDGIRRLRWHLINCPPPI
jgi:hypothetical protein